MYVLNDLLDVQADRNHPQKRDRPLASGRVSPAAGVVLLALLLLLGAAAGALLPTLFLFFAGLYLANSLLYCFFLKHRAIIDVMMIAAGFVLRLCWQVVRPSASRRIRGSSSADSHSHWCWGSESGGVK